MSIAAQLFHLEQLDGEIEQRTALLRDLARRLKSDPAAEDLQRRLEETQRQEAAAATEQRRLEGDLADLETRIRRDRDRLWSGRIIDPREIAAMERELEHLQGQRDALEERVLTVMERADTLRTQSAELSQDLAAHRDRQTSDRPALLQQARAEDARLTALRAERTGLVAEVGESNLALYERLRRTAGHAVVSVEEGVCGGCRISLPPRDVHRARTGTLVTCTNCNRILFSQ